MINTQIPLYGIMILLSFIANILVVAYISGKYDFSKTEILCLLLYENTGMIIGAKVLTFFENYQDLDGFDFLSLGLTSYGALIGALVFLLLFCLQFKKPFAEMLCIFMTPIPLMYAIGKIGCFLAGCCHGIEYSGWGSVIYRYSRVAPKDVPLFPVQIVETIVFAGVFLYMLIKHQKKWSDLKTLGIALALCGFFKFLLDYLRMSHAGQILSSNQAMSIAAIFIGVVVIIRQRRTVRDFHQG